MKKSDATPYTPITESQFKCYLSGALFIAVDAISTFELFYSLTSPSQKKKFGKVFTKHSKVLNFTMRSLLHMLVLSLYKLNEDSDNPVSVSHCISKALQLELIGSDERKFLRGKINKVIPIWKKVGVLRHELIGHRDSSIPVSKVFETANVSPKELRTLALAYCEVLNDLLKAIGKKPFDPKDYSDRLFQDLETFLNDLVKAV